MAHDLETHRSILASYFPGGEVWDAKAISENVVLPSGLLRAGSTLYRLIRGFAPTMQRADMAIDELFAEMMPDETSKMVAEWERALAIPDDCFPGTGTIEQRRRHILLKLSSLGLQTRQDFENFAIDFGIAVQVRSGIEHVAVVEGGYETALPTMALATFGSVKEARFTMVCTYTDPTGGFEFDFAIPFGGEEVGRLNCLFERLKPSNVAIVFQLA